MKLRKTKQKFQEQQHPNQQIAGWNQQSEQQQGLSNLLKILNKKMGLPNISQAQKQSRRVRIFPLQTKQLPTLKRKTHTKTNSSKILQSKADNETEKAKHKMRSTIFQSSAKEKFTRSIQSNQAQVIIVQKASNKGGERYMNREAQQMSSVSFDVHGPNRERFQTQNSNKGTQFVTSDRRKPLKTDIDNRFNNRNEKSKGYEQVYVKHTVSLEKNPGQLRQDKAKRPGIKMKQMKFDSQVGNRSHEKANKVSQAKELKSQSNVRLKWTRSVNAPEQQFQSFYRNHKTRQIRPKEPNQGQKLIKRTQNLGYICKNVDYQFSDQKIFDYSSKLANLSKTQEFNSNYTQKSLLNHNLSLKAQQMPYIKSRKRPNQYY